LCSAQPLYYSRCAMAFFQAIDGDGSLVSRVGRPATIDSWAISVSSSGMKTGEVSRGISGLPIWSVGPHVSGGSESLSPSIPARLVNAGAIRWSAGVGVEGVQDLPKASP